MLSKYRFRNCRAGCLSFRYPAVFPAITLLCSLLLCGCRKPNDKAPKTQRDNTSPHTGTSSIPGSTNTTMDIQNPFATQLNLPLGVVTMTEPELGRTGPRAIIQVPDGTRYEGEVRDGKPNGQGVLTDQNGTRQEG